jgi:hypothetical protein
MRCTAVAVVLLAVSGIVHGVWTHRWERWSAPVALARAERIEHIPLELDEWKGEPIKTDQEAFPEELVGHSVTIEYTNRADKSTVKVYLACGRTTELVAHTPRACYVANGYTCPTSDMRVAVRAIPPNEGVVGEFSVSNFSKPSPLEPGAQEHLRVFWAWSDGTGWRVPGNPERTFRHSPVIYKCYALRAVGAPDEPTDGDPAARLLAALVPQLDAVLAPAN